MEPAPPEKILEAFKTLDIENKGFLTKENFGKLMMEEGEPFTQEEMDEMWPVAIDPISGHIPYELYLNQLMVRANQIELLKKQSLIFFCYIFRYICKKCFRKYYNNFINIL